MIDNLFNTSMVLMIASFIIYNSTPENAPLAVIYYLGLICSTTAFTVSGLLRIWL